MIEGYECRDELRRAKGIAGLASVVTIQEETEYRSRSGEVSFLTKNGATQ